MAKNKIAPVPVARTRPDVITTIEALRKGEEEGFPPTAVFYGLSGLTSSEVRQLHSAWEALDGAYRVKLMQRLAETSETDFEMDYRAAGMMGLDDPEPGVRQAAIEMLWMDNSLELMHRLMTMAQSDPSVEVRAAAVSALGRFILEGELEELTQNETVQAQQIAIQLLKDETLDVEIRRRALEAIANCSHEMVPDAIQKAYRSGNQRMKVSSVFAMGRTCDERWSDIVLNEIESDDAEIRYEATRAAGELEMVEAVPHLGRLIAEDDREIKEVAIWSLGEIGGREAMRILNAVLEVAEDENDDDLIEAIEDAIGNASMMGGDFFPDLDMSEVD